MDFGTVFHIFVLFNVNRILLYYYLFDIISGIFGQIICSDCLTFSQWVVCHTLICLD